MRLVEADREAEWAHGQTTRQDARKWAVAAIKNELSPVEWWAACRAVRQCSPAFDEMRRALVEPVDGGARGDYGMALRVTAMRRLGGVESTVKAEVGDRRSVRCLHGIVRMGTLTEIAVQLGQWRKMGSRPPIPDARAAKPVVRLVTLAIAKHYEGETEGATDMNEVQMGVGEGWTRMDDQAEFQRADIPGLEAAGFQVVVTAAGGVYVRDPNEPSYFQPRPVDVLAQIREL